MESLECINLRELVRLSSPVVLWQASPMASCHTGLRPSGESVKLFGAWWKLEGLTVADIRKKTQTWEMFEEDSYPPPYLSPKADVVNKLVSVIDAAIKNGVSRDDICGLVNARIIVTTMED